MTLGVAIRRLPIAGRQLFLPIGTWCAVTAALAMPATASLSRKVTLRPVSRAAPAIEVRVPTQDAGVIEEGSVFKCRFTVANRGRTDLVVRNVKPSCSCSVARWPPVIKPGQEGVIETEFNSAYFHGRVNKEFTVASNDPAQPELKLHLTADVTPLVQITPAPVALLSLDAGPTTQEFILARSGGHPMQILQVFPNSPYLKVQTTTLPGTGRYKVTVTAAADTPPGRATTWVALRTDMEKAENLTLVVTVDRGIIAIPPRVILETRTGGVLGSTLGVVTITRRSGPFAVTAVTADDPMLRTKLETIRKGAEYRLTVTYGGASKAGLEQRMLTVTTDDPKQPTLSVPVNLLAQGSAG